MNPAIKMFYDAFIYLLIEADSRCSDQRVYAPRGGLLDPGAVMVLSIVAKELYKKVINISQVGSSSRL